MTHPIVLAMLQDVEYRDRRLRAEEYRQRRLARRQARQRRRAEGCP